MARRKRRTNLVPVVQALRYDQEARNLISQRAAFAAAHTEPGITLSGQRLSGLSSVKGGLEPYEPAIDLSDNQADHGSVQCSFPDCCNHHSGGKQLGSQRARRQWNKLWIVPATYTR